VLARKTLVMVGAPFVLVGLAAAWILISPLFIRPTLVEDSPLVAQPAATNATILARGEFDTKDTVHRGSGRAVLARTPEGKTIVRFEDFSVTNGPDLFVILSAHPRPNNSEELHQGGADINLGPLKAPQGAFSYEIPSDVDLSNVKSVAIYCRAFRVMFSSAELVAP
jgi:hypothetical protein